MGLGEILGIVGIVIGIFGILITLYCWKHTWKEVLALYNMKTIDITKENGMATFHKNALIYSQEKATDKPAFEFNDDMQNNMKACISNMVDNVNKKQ